MTNSKPIDDALLKIKNLRQGVLEYRRRDGKSVEDRRSFVPPWTKQLVAPFTYFGGKRKVAEQIWEHLGKDIPNYIEPFAGGLAVLLARPSTDVRTFDGTRHRELANDTDGLLLNFWRTVQQQQCEDLSRRMDFPAMEKELLLRRKGMLDPDAYRGLVGKLENNLDYCDQRLAAYWLYVQREWIGGGSDDMETAPRQKMPRAKAIGKRAATLEDHFEYLRIRTRHVRFFNGDWKATVADDAWERCLKAPTQTTNMGTTGVFLDPPYVDTGDVYGGIINKLDSSNEAPYEAREWALANGDSPDFRIVYCGYERHHRGEFPSNWVAWHWQKAQGYKKPDDERPPEIDTIWFSPHCLNLDQIARLESVDPHTN